MNSANDFEKELLRKIRSRLEGRNTLGGLFIASEPLDSSINMNVDPRSNHHIMKEHLQYLNEHWEINPNPPVHSKKKILGKIIVFIKRAIRKCMRWYMVPMINYQTEFNGNVVNTLNQLNSIVDNFEHCMRKLDDFKVEYNNKLADIQNEYNHLQNELNEEKTKNDLLNRKLMIIEDNISYISFKISQLKSNRVTYLDRDRFIEKETAIQEHNESNFELDYFMFENRFRGSREMVKDSLEKYLKFFKGKHNVIDIGCGRGEFLDLLAENDISVIGVDVNHDFIQYNQQRGHVTIEKDAVEYLASLESCSVGGIFMAQVLEHLSEEYIYMLLEISYDKLKPGCYFIAETPNPRTLAIFNNWFYADMSHIKPVHPDVMQYLLACNGYQNIEIILSDKYDFDIPELEIDNANSNVEEFNKAMRKVNETIFGYQNYAIIGKK